MSGEPVVITQHAGPGWQTSVGAEVSEMIEQLRWRVEAELDAMEGNIIKVLFIAPPGFIGDLCNVKRPDKTLKARVDQERLLGHAHMVVSIHVDYAVSAMLARGHAKTAQQVIKLFNERDGRVVVAVTTTHLTVLRIRRTMTSVEGISVDVIGQGGDA